MDRDVLTDAHWERIEPLLPGQVGSVGVSAKDNRLFLKGVLWIGVLMQDRGLDTAV